ncbi:MAG TPA: ABC transporter ATP-binding protein [Gemmatimonadales bacterium]|jgi:subfamily B ATP-binding cassette protein MsbA
MTASQGKKKTDYRNAWAEAKAIIWVYRWRLAVGMVLMLISRIAGLVLPATPKYLIDDVIGKHRADLLPVIVIAVAAATLVQAVTSFALSQLLGVAAQRAITEMRKQVQEHVARLPVSYFDSSKTGILISRIMTDAEGIRNLVGSGLVQLIGGFVTAILALGYLFHLNWRITTVTLTILIVFGTGMATAFNRLRPLFRERGKINADVTGRLNETLGGIRVVKAYTAERRERYVFATGAHRLFRNVAKSITAVSGTGAFASLVVGAIGVLMIWWGGRTVLAGRMSAGELLTYAIFTGYMALPLIQIANIGTQVSEAFAGLDRIREIRTVETEDKDDAILAPAGNINGDVVFENVSFAYNPGLDVLKHISFHSPAGTTTALVGSSGSGKSTLISLVMAFNRLREGRILIDGRDLSSIRLREYRRSLGVVLQENFLFDGTVAENIAFARPHATRAEIEEVGRVANADEFIRGFPEGYDSVVGERGIKLSGGQRQRISIARAILADPRILILDEATSSLDSESEALIQEGLRALRKGRTAFVIAHRLSTIVSADQILVLENGEIVERGTHRELLATGGRYRQLYDRQYKVELDRFINPGEDFTPEPEKDAPRVAVSQNL